APTTPSVPPPLPTRRSSDLELAVLLRDFPCKINLIPFNPFPLSEYRRPAKAAIERFWSILTEAGYVVTVRTTRGDDIDAACGQRSEEHTSELQSRENLVCRL